MRVRDTAAWFAVSRKVVLLAVGVVVLLVLAGAAALLVDAVEVTGPEIIGQGFCGHGSRNVFLSVQGSDAVACQWGAALSRKASRTLLLKVSENESGAFQATATITTVAADPLVTMVQRGDGQDANEFVGAVVGSVIVGGNGFTWSAPTVTIGSAGKTAVISMTGRPPDGPPMPSTVQLDVGTDSLPSTVQVTTQHRIISAVLQGNPHGRVKSETAHSLSTGNFGGSLQVTLRPGSTQPFASPPGPAGSHWVARAASTAWGLLSGFAGLLATAGAWIAMLLASRMGAFGAVGRGPAWRRMEWILGAVVVAHLAISACFQLTSTDESLTSSLLNSPSLPDRLFRAMASAGLWSPNGYPAVEGGVILLIAFSVTTAVWGPRERKPAASRRRHVGALIALVTGTAAAVASYTALAYANMPVDYETLPDGSVHGVANRPSLAVEIPAVTVCALLVVCLAAAWVGGALRTGPAAASGSPHAGATRFPRFRVATGGPALAAAVALIGMGLAAAFAYSRVPLTVWPTTLWNAGTLAAVALSFTLLLLSLALLVAAGPAGPRVGPGPRLGPARIPFILGVTAAVTAVTIFIALGVTSDYMSTLALENAFEGNMSQFSGTTVLIACLALAAVFALAAGVASRPWRAGGFLNLMYWVVPLIVVLAAAASLTNDGGYIPVFIRWGVLIVAGAFLGMAVVRLTVSAAGPLRPTANRTPHLVAAALSAVVVAVPWGELGSNGVQIGWWDFLTYANRVDGVLPLVLVVAGVTALRRLGLIPSRDETTLSSHRKLGIAAWIVVLSGSYAFGGSADLGTSAALAVAAVAAWLLMPHRQVRRASVVLSQTEQEAAAAVGRAVEIGVARRTLPGLAKTMREEVAAGKADFAEAQEKVTALEERASSVSAVVLAGPHQGLRVTDDELAFGAFISPQAWKRAQWGAGYAVIAGALWVLLGLAGASVPLSREGYPELALVSAVAPLVLRWAGYGLLFGYFFPLLRGTTGLSKSISFFTAAAPSIIGTLTSPGQQWHSAALLGVQLLIFALTMGLLADLAVLRKNGFTASRLVDLHSLWTVSAWASSVAVAIGTGIATIILAGLQPFVIGVITPSPASTPPAATSHP